MKSRFLFLLLLALLTFPPHNASAQTSVAQQLVLSAQSQLKQGSGTVSLQVNATAIQFIGSDAVSGSATFLSSDSDHVRFEYTLGTTHRTETKTTANGQPECFWSNADAVAHLAAEHNCLEDAGWFTPAFGVLFAANAPYTHAVYVGREKKDGLDVQHLTIYQRPPAQRANTADIIARLSSVDVYLDATSYLPVAETFNVHPEDDETKNIPVEIHYANYRNVSGMMIPFRVQKLVNNTLFLDMTVQSVEVNPTITSNSFQLQ